MEIKKENLKDSRIKLTIRVKPEELAGYFRLAYEKLANETDIEGFRTGKAPFRLIEAKVGRNRLITEGIDCVLKESYPIAAEKEKIFPISQPEVKVKKVPGFSLDANEIKDDFEYEIEVDIMPEIKLGDYKKLKIKKPERRSPKPEDVQKIIDHLRKQKATFKESKAGAKKGDRVEINFDGFLKKVKIDEMCSKNHPLVLGEGNLIPGFEEKIIGMKKAEKKKFKIKFPKDYHQKKYADKEAEFEVELLDLRQIVLPKIDEKLAEVFGHNSVLDLKKAVKESLKKEMDFEYQNKLEGAVIEKVLPLLKAELPESLIENELLRILEDFKKQVEARGISFENYLKSIKKDIDSLKKNMRPQAEKNIKIGFILGKIIEERKFDAKDKDAGKKALEYLVKKIAG